MKKNCPLSSGVTGWISVSNLSSLVQSAALVTTPTLHPLLSRLLGAQDSGYGRLHMKTQVSRQRSYRDRNRAGRRRVTGESVLGKGAGAAEVHRAEDYVSDWSGSTAGGVE